MRLAVALLIALTGSAQAAPACMDDETREAVRGLIMDGVNTGLREHAKRLFDVWMKEPNEEPTRQIAGLQNAINAFVRTRAAMSNWAPPTCKGDKP